MSDLRDLERDLHDLAAELRRLEAEYNQFFAGRRPRPPWEIRSSVEARLKKLDRAALENHALRFRVGSLQARYSAFADLWDRALRAREEGREGPLAQRSEAKTARGAPTREASMSDRVLHVASFSDPSRELDKLRELYDSLASARRETGEPPIAFHRFAELIRDQVQVLRRTGTPEVAFRVAVKEGKVALTARAIRRGAAAGGRQEGGNEG